VLLRKSPASLEDATKAFALASSPREDVLKVVLVPS